ncbi:MAG: hypothetical protein KDD39_03825, partial [Bdellovibrionales bacterium]|nr:hypothetical protein [Bdellovibrionales bacterium]
FDVKALPVRPFPTVDPSKPNECNFGLDLGDGLKAMRVLGYNKDGGTVFAAYEEHLRQARRKPGLVRIFNVPFELLRALPTGTDEQKRNQFERWARRATTEREMEILHALKSPILIPVQVPSNWDETAFHLYLLATTERSSRQFIGRYEVFAAIEGLKRRVRACRRAVILAGERLVGSFFRRPGN